MYFPMNHTESQLFERHPRFYLRGHKCIFFRTRSGAKRCPQKTQNPDLGRFPRFPFPHPPACQNRKSLSVIAVVLRTCFRASSACVHCNGKRDGGLKCGACGIGILIGVPPLGPMGSSSLPLPAFPIHVGNLGLGQ